MGVGEPRARRPRSCSGVQPRSTGWRGAACGTAGRRWTPSSRSGPSPAYGWSAFVVVLAATAATLYLEVAAAVTVFILAGRYAEERAKRQLGRRAARAPRAGRQGRRRAARRTPDGEADEVRIPIAELVVGDRFVVRPGEKIATDGVVERGHVGDRRVAPHRRVGPGRGRSGRRRRRRDRQRRWAIVVHRDPRRCRHRARADRAASSPTRSRARRPCSGSPTGSPAVFVPVVLVIAVAHARRLAR